jgi:hypothetical protein
MTAPMISPSPPSPPSRPRRTGSRTAAIVVASVLAALGISVSAMGAVALWGDGQRDDDGYFSTAAHRYTTPTSALTTEDIDVEGDAPRWLAGDEDIYGDMRLRVESRDGGPVFAGIARTADVERYLAGTAHTAVTDIETDPFRAEYSERSGDRRPAAPGGQRFWVASTEGEGRRTLDWDVREGNWSVVVMNADGSRGVDADVSAGVSVGFLQSLGWGLLGGGALLLLLGAGVAAAGVRRG